MDAFVIDDKILTVESFKCQAKKLTWKRPFDCSGLRLQTFDDNSLKTITVNPEIYQETSKLIPVQHDWTVVYLLAFYIGDAIKGDGGVTSLWYSVNNNTLFSICSTYLRLKALTWFDFLRERLVFYGEHFATNLTFCRACRLKPSGCRQGVTAIHEARRFICKPLELKTMQKFVSMKTKTGGIKKNSKVQVELNGTGEDIRIANKDDGEQFEFASLHVRVLDDHEEISFDFQESKEISDIVSELRGNLINLNDLTIDAVFNACKMFSGHCHSVKPNQPVPIDRVTLFEVNVDIDSALCIYKRCNVNAEKKTIDVILKDLSDNLGANWTGFQMCTNYCANNDWMKAIPSSKAGGPTIEPFEDGGRFRIHLPTPQGSEVLQVYIYSPKKLDYMNFVQCVKKIIHNCASTLLRESRQDRLFQALQSTHDMKLHGGKPIAIPGGYKLALGTALQFLEENPEGALALETYNCKQKCLTFKMPARDFGTDSWLNTCVHKMKEMTKHCGSVIKSMCRLDRLAEMDPTLSSLGFGFELR